MTAEWWFVFAGDVLIALGFVVSIGVYFRQRKDSERRDRRAALAMLEAVRDGLASWAEPYFGKSYTEATARARAQEDFDVVVNGGHASVFQVPTEPLTALIRRPGVGGLVDQGTIEAVNAALWHIGIFNQFVQQQTDFNARHMTEFADQALPEDRRRVLAEAARRVSFAIEWWGVNDGAWYRRLVARLEANIQSLRCPA